MPKKPNTASHLAPEENPKQPLSKGKPLTGRESFIYTESLPPEAAEIDRGWSLEPTPESVVGETGARIKTAAMPEIHVTAEDGLKPGQEALTDILDENGIQYPDYLRIYSGDNTHASDRMDFQDSSIAVDTSAGDVPTNADGIAMMLDKDGKRVLIAMAHGPQHDPMAANLSNVAATKSAVEFAASHPERMIDVARRIDSDIVKAGEDLGVEFSDDKRIDYLVAELDPGDEFYHFSVSGRGKMQCVVLNPEDGSVAVVPPFLHAVSPEQAQKIWDDIVHKTSDEGIEEILKKTATGKETPEMVERQRARLKAKCSPEFRSELLVDWIGARMEPGEREALKVYVRESEVRGVPFDRTIGTVISFLEQPLYYGRALEEGEVVIMATPEVTDYLKQQKTSLPMRYFLELAEGTPLESIGNDLMEEVLRAQKDGKIPDSSVSIVAVRAPATETVKARKDQESLDKEIDDAIERLIA